MPRYVDIDKPRYVRYTDERSGEVVTSEQTIADLLDGSIGLIGEEIVRCKDCKHHTYEEPGMVYCLNNFIGGWVANDFFCKDGEWRE